MEHPVWKICNANNWTKEGQKEIEEIYDSVFRIFQEAKFDDIKTLIVGLDVYHFDTIEILDTLMFRKERGELDV